MYISIGLIITIATIMVVGLGVFIWIIRNLIKKQESAEDILVSYMEYLNNISTIIKISDEKLKEIDEKGTFKSDDEIGFFFQNIQAIQELLNDFKIKKI